MKRKFKDYFFLPFIIISVFSCRILASSLESTFERNYLKASAILVGKVTEAKFEEETTLSPVRRYFATIRVITPIKGNINEGESVKVFIGGKTMYKGRIWQVGDTDLPVGLSALFFLVYLFPDERDFTVGAEYFLDKCMPVSKGVVNFSYPKRMALNVHEILGEFNKIQEKHNARNVFETCDLIVIGRVRTTKLTRSQKGKLLVTIGLEVVEKVKGDKADSAITVSYIDHYRRIHYRNRKRSDVPFYITKDRTAIQKENRRNFFLVRNEEYLFCLKRDDDHFCVNYNHHGIFRYDKDKGICNRSMVNKPEPIVEFVDRQQL